MLDFQYFTIFFPQWQLGIATMLGLLLWVNFFNKSVVCTFVSISPCLEKIDLLMKQKNKYKRCNMYYKKDKYILKEIHTYSRQY
ncbi:hypothetical protein BDF21DRAFT_409597 [Thamnidium elegans]|nr:hypothetical protein BDF21DRAFT_409597 [Thamnidium elegans]